MSGRLRQSLFDANLAINTGAGGSNGPPVLPIPITPLAPPIDAEGSIPINPLAETSSGTTTATTKSKKDLNGRVKKSTRWVLNNI